MTYHEWVKPVVDINNNIIVKRRSYSKPETDKSSTGKVTQWNVVALAIRVGFHVVCLPFP